MKNICNSRGSNPGNVAYVSVTMLTEHNEVL